MTSRHVSPRSVAIIVAEQAYILTSLALFIALDASSLGPRQMIAQVGFAGLLYATTFYYCELYDFSKLQLRQELLTAAVRAFSVLALIFGTLFLLTHWLPFRSTTILIHLLVTGAFVMLVRPQMHAFLTQHGVVTRIAVVGTGAEAQRLATETIRRPESGLEVCCFVSTGEQQDPIRLRTPNPGVRTFPVIASSALADFALQKRISRILVATADLGNALPVDDLLRCKAEGYEVLDGHTFYERLLGRLFVEDLSPHWLIFAGGFTRPAWLRVAKRTVDIISATLIAVFTAPLSLLVAILVKLDDGGPVLYRQMRVGRNGVPFSLLKFRSMRIDAEAESGPKWAEPDDSRVTRTGAWIRLLRIDEIPQAWNVLRGDMSFVGPRPERPEFLAELRQAIPYYDLRHGIRPGITGWAQVNLPYGATVDESRQKLEYDLYYLKNFSGLLDFFILAKTVKIILFGWGSR